MSHIELALNVLKDEISKLNIDMKYGHFLPKHETEIRDMLQKLNQAIDDISNKFNM